VGRKCSAKQKAFGTALAQAVFLSLRSEKAPLFVGGFFRPLLKAGGEVGKRGVLFNLSLMPTIDLKMGNGIIGRAARLRKENPRGSYAVWTKSKIRAARLRQLPTDLLSCGNQPAHIRMIIVASACLGLLFRFSEMSPEILDK
jgi:hypothetical protein